MKYRKLPVEIEAFKIGYDNIPDWFMDKVTDKTIILRTDKPKENTNPFDHNYKTWCEIKTLEGIMTGDYGDFIIRDIKGEIYPCKPDIFEKTYKEIK